MKTLGRHIVAEFFGCEGAAIDDLARVEAWMLGPRSSRVRFTGTLHKA